MKAEKDEFGIIYNNDYKAWYIIFRVEGTNEFKVDTKCKVRLDEYENDCVTDSFLERIKELAQNGYEFNPYLSSAYACKIDLF